MTTIQQDNFQEIKPKRSMSYNDLKKRRLLRSKSKSKLQKFQSDSISKTQRKTPQTQCKSTKTVTSNHQNIIQNCLKQVKDTLSEIKQQSKTTSIKQIISKQFYTDRTQTHHQKNQLQNKINGKLSFYDKSDYIKQEKEVIKSIIMKKKSQRRLLRYSEIREQVKKSKSKSNDKSDEKRQKKDDDTTISIKKDRILKNQKNNQSFNSAKKIRAKKFQLVPETNFMTDRPTVKQAVQVNQQIQEKDAKKKQIFKNCSRRKLKKSISHIIIKTKVEDKQKSSINFDSLNMKQEIISIEKVHGQTQNQKKFISSPKKAQTQIIISVQKNTSLTKNKIENPWINQEKKILKENGVINSQNNQQKQNQNEKPINISGISSIQQKRNNSNFQSCLDIVQELQCNQKAFLKTSEADEENCSNISNILNLLVLPTTQLKIKLTNNKNGKRKHDLQKFKKVFPKNFFKN